MMYVLGFLLCPASVIIVLLMLYMLVMRSPPPTIFVQIHFVAVAPDLPAAGCDDQMRGQEPNNEQNDAEVAEWETPVQEAGQRTRSVMVVGTETAPDQPAEDLASSPGPLGTRLAEDQEQEEPNDDAEDAECCRSPVQETPRIP